jgi:hypothetical protein
MHSPSVPPPAVTGGSASGTACLNTRRPVLPVSSSTFGTVWHWDVPGTQTVTLTHGSLK